MRRIRPRRLSDRALWISDCTGREVASHPEPRRSRRIWLFRFILVAFSMMEISLPSQSRPTAAAAEPILIHVRAADVATSADVARLVRDTRARADAFVFLSGGASKMSPEAQRRLRALVDALALLTARGVRLAVGDGGTQAGIMEAAGLARRAAGSVFPLIGVAPAPDVTASGEAGKTSVDPNHSQVVTVENPGWADARRAEGWKPQDGYWGSETAAMYAIFGRFAEGRPSVALVANGGAIALDEVRENLAQRRPIIVIAGSGRAADAIVSLLDGTIPTDVDVQGLREKAAALDIPANRSLLRVFRLEDGPEALAKLLERILRES
jgi:SLOG in TRPM, prokaryote